MHFHLVYLFQLVECIIVYWMMKIWFFAGEPIMAGSLEIKRDNLDQHLSK